MPWFADLQARVAQLQEWTANFEVRATAVLPYSMWLPGMFNQVRWHGCGDDDGGGGDNGAAATRLASSAAADAEPPPHTHRRVLLTRLISLSPPCLPYTRRWH